MKFINQYTNMVYNTIEECEASEKEFLEKESHKYDAVIEKFFSKDISEAWNEVKQWKDKDAIFDVLKKRFPYSGISEFIKKYWNSNENVDTKLRYMYLYHKYPFIEKLIKSEMNVGFIAQTVGYGWCWRDCQSKLKKLKNGNTLEEILGLKNWQIAYLKGKDPTELVSTIKRFKTREEMEAVIKITNNFAIGPTRTNEVCYLVNQKLTTYQALDERLEAIWNYQAIEKYEAIKLLAGYAKMCKKIGIEPDIKTNSLKREYDLRARDMIAVKDRDNEKRFLEIADKRRDMEFENEDFIARIPRSLMEIQHEGNEMHNCFGWYWKYVLRGTTKMVLLVRRKSDPDRPYIDMSIGRDGSVTQYLLSCNRSPDGEKELAFLEAYKKHLKSINA